MGRGAHLDRVHLAAREAIASGATPDSASSITRDVSGRCERPTIRTYEGRPAGNGGNTTIIVGPGTAAPYWVDFVVRCRRCAACLAQNAREWQVRAVRETLAAPRTWFGTLTLSPENHYLMKARAARHLGSRGWEAFERLSPEQQFKARHDQIYKDLTKYIKRVRKNSGAMLRYILVAEAHTGKRGQGENYGLPHYHMLVHEYSGMVSYRDLSDNYSLGFSKWKLVPADDNRKAAWYVCKYLRKDGLARVRASVRYGQYDLPVIVNEENVKTLTPPNKHF